MLLSAEKSTMYQSQTLSTELGQGDRRSVAKSYMNKYQVPYKARISIRIKRVVHRQLIVQINVSNEHQLNGRAWKTVEGGSNTPGNGICCSMTQFSHDGSQLAGPCSSQVLERIGKSKPISISNLPCVICLKC